MKLSTRVFELSNRKYRNLVELAQTMEISQDLIYRVRKGERGSKGGDGKMKRAVIINPKDNTATALNNIDAGDTVSLTSKSGQAGEIKARQTVPFGHKLALATIGKGEEVLKYGEVIGLATHPINEGDYVHVHNVESALLPPPKEVE